MEISSLREKGEKINVKVNYTTEKKNYIKTQIGKSYVTFLLACTLQLIPVGENWKL